MQDDSRWHLDKRVPIALIFTILLQAGAFVWWAGHTASQIEIDRRDISRNESRIDRLENSNTDTRERMVAIEANLRFVGRQLQQIDTRLAKILERLENKQAGGK